MIGKDVKHLLILDIEDFVSVKENRALKKPSTNTLPFSEEISDTEKDFVEGNHNTP